MFNKSSNPIIYNFTYKLYNRLVPHLSSCEHNPLKYYNAQINKILVSSINIKLIKISIIIKPLTDRFKKYIKRQRIEVDIKKIFDRKKGSRYTVNVNQRTKCMKT